MIALLSAGGLSVFLSPDDACVSSIVREPKLAESEVFVQATVVTMPRLLDAFEDAIKRGVGIGRGW